MVMVRSRAMVRVLDCVCIAGSLLVGIFDKIFYFLVMKSF